ncbi:MAG: MFS transporter [Planctomycetaceae bacterium]|nr:MFS transporter [Planctomycetaceae bacterium]
MQSNSSPARQILQNYVSLPSTVHILCLGSFINRVGSFVMLFLTIYVSEELKMGKAFASYCIGAFGVGSILSALLGGQLADQIGRRATMLIALLGGASILASLSFIQNGYVFMASLFVFALVMEMYRPAASAMIGDVANSEQRPHAYSLMYISFNLGFAIAPPIGGWLASRSFQWLFWGDALTSAMYGMVVLFLLKETHPRKQQQLASSVMAEEAKYSGDTPEASAEALASSERLQKLNHADASAASTREYTVAEAFTHIVRDSNFLLFCFCSLITSIVFMQAFVTLPLFVRGMGFDEQQFGFMICVNGAMIVLLQLPMTHWLSRYNRVHVLLAGELLLAIGFGVTGFVSSAATIVGSIMLWTLGEILQAPYKPTIVAELAPVALRARYMGIFNISHAASIAIGAPLGGEVLARFGPKVLWPACGSLLLVTSVLYWMLFRKLQAAEKQRTSGIAATTAA